MMAAALHRRTAAIAVVLAAILFVAANVISGQVLRGARLDLTADRLYTLSPGTKHLLSNLKEPITLRFFYSRKLAEKIPGLRTYGQRVREMLEEYADRSGGNIKLIVVDPEPFSAEEDRAVEAGIQQIPVDRNSGEQAYFGLVGENTTDTEVAIPFFPEDRARFLEYDLTKLIYTLTSPKKPVLGVIGDMPLEYGPGGVMAAMRGQSKPYAVMDQLRETYDVRTQRLEEKPVDDDVQVLLIAHPREVSEMVRYHIDQFLMRKGRAIVYVDPWAETLAMQPGPTGRPDPTAPHNSDLPTLFKSWGLKLVQGKFVADPGRALQVNFGEGASRRASPYPAWHSLDKSAYNPDDVLTGDLGAMTMASPGALEITPVPGLTVAPLVTSTKDARLVAIDSIRMRPDPAQLAAEMAKAGKGEKYTMAVRVTGKLKSVFDAPPKPKEEKKAAGKDEKKEGEEKKAPEKPFLKEGQGTANIVVVADADMLDDSFWVQEQNFFGRPVQVPFAANGEFLINAVDNLAGSSDLIGLRSRGGARRPFTLIDDIQRAAGAKFLARQQDLQKSLDDTQKKLTELQSKQTKGAGAQQLMSAEERSAVEGFQKKVLEIRKELRAVQHDLNQDIDRLVATVKIVNIALVPLAVAVIALIVAAVRRRRRTARVVRE